MLFLRLKVNHFNPRGENFIYGYFPPVLFANIALEDEHLGFYYLYLSVVVYVQLCPHIIPSCLSVFGANSIQTILNPNLVRYGHVTQHLFSSLFRFNGMIRHVRSLPNEASCRYGEHQSKWYEEVRRAVRTIAK